MKINNNKIKSFIFFISIFLYFFKSVFISLELPEDLIGGVSNIINALILAILSPVILLSNKKQCAFIIFLIILFVYNAIFYNNIYMFGFIIISCMLILSNEIYWRDIIRYLSLAHFLVVLFIIPLVFFAEKYSFIDDRFGVRYTFGFHNPNTFSQYLISLYVVFLLLFVEVIKKKSLQFLTVIILTLFIYGVISLTGSRTGMILTIITGFGFLACTLSKTNDKKRRKFVYLYILGAGVLCFVQYYLVLTFNHSEFSKTINTILSGRIWFSSQLTSQLWPVPYFHGVNINDYLPIDFFYVAYFYNLGIFIGFWFIYLFIRKMFVQTYTPVMVIVLWLSLAITVTENYYAIPLYNISLFIVFSSRYVINENENSCTYPSSQK